MFVQWSAGAGWWASSTTEHKENWNRKVYYSQVLEEVRGKPWGSTWKSEVRVQTESAGPGTHDFTRVPWWSALCFPRLCQIDRFKPKEQGFGQPHKGLV